MSNYIWFNPVVKSLHSQKELDDLTNKFSFTEINVTKDWINYVKEEYYKLSNNSTNPVIDMRCPMAASLVKEEYNRNYNFSDIHPILIYCAIDLAEQYLIEEDDYLTITTPCQSLADLGNSLALKNVKFITWLNLIKELNYRFESKPLSKSPIPPGFFTSNEVNVLNLKSKKEIVHFFENKHVQSHDIVEMLYCENGCHNGDGIVES